MTTPNIIRIITESIKAATECAVKIIREIKGE